jgi:hypothetical protein
VAQGAGSSGGGRSGSPVGPVPDGREPDVPAKVTGVRHGVSDPVAPTSTVHRNAMLAALRPEQIPVAEQLLRGGLPAVRQAIDAQNATAKASGRPAASTDALLAMADELLPVVKLADWKDRATAAQAAGKDFRLRELRTVVAASRTVILDEEGRRTWPRPSGVAGPPRHRPAGGVAGPHHQRDQRRAYAAGARSLHSAPQSPAPGARPTWP